jgi:nucleoside-diphosphate-sugar epimerase
MRVLLTGGTGFVGSWTALALQQSGHEVRLLVRRPDQVERTFAPHGRVPHDVVVGDVTDEAAVRQAVEGCESVVHAAAVFSFDPRRATEMTRTNAAATERVLGAAVAHGCDPVVHVSSTVSLTRRAPTNPDLELGDVTLPYSASKIASEQVARDLQAEEHPVVSIYPGAVYGPRDPYRGEQAERLWWVARGLFPLWAPGGLHSVDVRETAATIASAVEPGRGPRRYVVPGHHVTGDDVFGAVSEALGRRRPHLVLGERTGRAITRAADAMQVRLPSGWRRYPADLEAFEVLLRNTRFDTGPATADLGVTTRPFGDTVRDTLEWMVDDGRLPPRYRPR